MMKHITVHCSATPTSMSDIGVAEIRKMHTDKGWSDIGYHYVIKRDGTLEAGRPESRTGAHVKGHNKDNIGVCMIGGVDQDNKPQNDFTPEQFDMLRSWISELCGVHGIHHDNIKGHRDWPNVAKACPCFDVRELLEEWMK